MLKWNDDQLTNQSICNSYIFGGTFTLRKGIAKEANSKSKILFEFWDSVFDDMIKTVLN